MSPPRLRRHLAVIRMPPQAHDLGAGRRARARARGGLRRGVGSNDRRGGGEQSAYLFKPRAKRIVEQVRRAGRGLHLRVAEELADHRQSYPAHKAALRMCRASVSDEPLKHDWDAFAGAIARLVQDHGMPVSQGELVRNMMDRFGAGKILRRPLGKNLAPTSAGWLSPSRPSSTKVVVCSATQYS